MTAAIAKGSEATQIAQGLRPVNPRQDMAQVARLIEISFAGDLDASSRRMVREMRAFGQAGWLGWLLGRLFLPPAAYPKGYVWQEGAELVGNASMLPVSRLSERWVLANVAVHPDCRRQGIASKMVSACLDLAEQKGATEVVLQVRHDNQGAIALYRGLGFRVLTTRTNWKGQAGLKASLERKDELRRARTEEWSILWRMVRDLFPEGAQWPYPLKQGWFEPASVPTILAPNRSRAWVHLDGGGQVTAGLVARLSQDSQGWQLIVLVPPGGQGELEMPLIHQAVHGLGSTGLPFALSYPPGLVDDKLAAAGFHSRRTLTWMGFRLAHG